MATNMAPAEHVCGACRESFPSFERLRRHKAELFAADRGHIHCYICLLDFSSVVTFVRHYQQSHAKKQELDCPGCGSHFTLMSSLVGHIEGRECRKINLSDLESLRQEKLRFGQELQKRNPDKAGINFSNYAGSQVGDTSEWNMNALRVHHSNRVVNPVYFKQDDFPSQTHSATSVSGHAQAGPATGKENAGSWAQPANLFPDGPAAQRPTPDQLATATAASARTQYQLGIHDPNHPHFDVQKYKGWSGLYECPMNNCPQSCQTADELTRHLRTLGSHGGRKYQCPCCLRMFKDLTSISQHAESPGNRCQVRHSDKYRTFLDQLTAGLVDVTAVNEDMTLKYEVSTEAVVRFGQSQKSAPGMTAEEIEAKHKREREQYLADRTWTGED